MKHPYTFVVTCQAVPTQVEGRRKSDNSPYYFRARHGRWELLVGEPSFPTELLDWPDGWDEYVVARGEDETRGFMSDRAVRAVLDIHLDTERESSRTDD